MASVMQSLRHWIYLLFLATPVHAQWLVADKPPYAVTSLAAMGGLVYSGYAGLAGTGNISKSTDGGNTWLKSDNGVSGAAVFAINSENSVLYAGTYLFGILRSIEGGRSWQPVDSMGAFTSINSFIRQGRSFYAGAQDRGFGLVLSSIDNGSHWKATMPRGLMVGPVYSLVANDSFVFASGWGGACFRSSDSGQSWIGFGPSGIVGAMFASDSTFVLGSGSGIYRSIDNGRTFAVAEGIPPKDSLGRFTSILRVSNTLIATMSSDSRTGGGGGGIFASSDDGQTWTWSAQGIKSAASENFSALALSGPTVLVGSEGGGSIWLRPSSELSQVSTFPNVSDGPARVFPNPFGTSATIRFTLRKQGLTTLTVWGPIGNVMEVQSLGHLAPGTHEVSVSASDMPEGVCFYRLRGADQEYDGKFLHLR